MINPFQKTRLRLVTGFALSSIVCFTSSPFALAQTPESLVSPGDATSDSVGKTDAANTGDQSKSCDGGTTTSSGASVQKPAVRLTKAGKKRGETINRILDALHRKPLTEEEQLASRKRTQERFEKVLDTVAEKSGMPPEDVAKYKKRLQERLATSSSQSSSEASKKLKAKIQEKLQCAAFFRATMYQLFDDHFTSDELRFLEKFVVSPTGQKLIAEAPDMMQEGVGLSLEHYVPMAIDFAKQYRRSRSLRPGKVDPAQEKMINEVKKMLQGQ